jgi:small subunit ribosomal protein S17
MTGEKIARKKRKGRQGTVLKAKMQKTIVVWVERRLRHPKYEKVVTTGKKYYVHDENNEAKAGDIVEIMETRPLSKLKRWRLVKIVKKIDQSIEPEPENVEAKNS